MDTVFEDVGDEGIARVKSSAYLKSLAWALCGDRSAEQTSKEPGPSPEP